MAGAWKEKSEGVLFLLEGFFPLVLVQAGSAASLGTGNCASISTAAMPGLPGCHGRDGKGCTPCLGLRAAAEGEGIMFNPLLREHRGAEAGKG